ncbi:MAG TPA: ABC-2 family transporter protein, partial [Nannocystaceae bacterium]|nr:ABC-2 family transporter protein [Nannocystaceae bacterium]
MTWFRRLLVTNLASSFALRTAFWLQAGLMALNNLMFFCFWWVLFTRFESIRGWAVGDVALLFGVAATGYGLCAVLLGGAQDLARQIDDGELDALLTTPKSVMLQALASRMRPDGFGDIVSGLALVAVSGAIDLRTIWLVPFAVIAAGTALAASWTLMQSLAFWFGKTQTTRMLGEMTLTFSVYPPMLFGPTMKIVLFTIIPAGFVSYLPVALLREPSLATFAGALGGAALYAALAVWIFGRGLRRYASG